MGARLREPVAGVGELGLLHERLRAEPVRQVLDALVEPGAVGVALAGVAVRGRQRAREPEAGGGVRLRGLAEAPQPRAGAALRQRDRRVDPLGGRGGRRRGPVARRDDDAAGPALAEHAQLALRDLGAHAGRERVPHAVDLDPGLGQAQRAHRALHGLLERGRLGLRGRLDLARARHPLLLAPA